MKAIGKTLVYLFPATMDRLRELSNMQIEAEKLKHLLRQLCLIKYRGSANQTEAAYYQLIEAYNAKKYWFMKPMKPFE